MQGGVGMMPTEPKKAMDQQLARITSVIGLIFSVFLLQPAALGAGHDLDGAAVAVISGLIAVLHDKRHGVNVIQAPKAVRSLLLWMGLLWSWQVLQLFWITSLDGSITVKSAITVLASASASWFILRDPQRRLLFAKGLIFILVATCVSYGIKSAH
jgi:hypothetical protein